MANVELNHFDLFVTCVDKVGPMLKIWGQVDRLSSMFVEQLLKQTSAEFEAQKGVVPLNKLSVGLHCCAKYKDGHYYRAQITNLRHLVSGSVEVKFIDYGNVEVITVENIRLLDHVATGLVRMKPQAVDFILANVIHINQLWDDKALSFIHSEIAYMELKSTVLGAVNNYRFIKIMFHDSDLSEHLIQRGIAAPVSLIFQENMIKSAIVNPMQSPNYPVAPSTTPEYSAPMSPMASTPELCRYKTLPLEPNSQHMVYISYVEDGPYLFSIQLQAMEDALEKLMIEINQITNLLPLSESPLPGYPCMARCLEDNSLCRAVVINLVEDKCKTYFVDFGNTDILPFSKIFQIPFKYMLPKVMSMRFTLAGLKSMKVTNEMKCAFKEFVTNRLLKLKVLKVENSPVLHCELFDENNVNIINILYDQINQYKTMPISKGMKYNVIVSFIEGCKKFFVQLKECSDSLNKLMLTLANTCESFSQLQNVEIGTPCVAFYSGDNQWYRASILSLTNDTATVKYVDYGNEDIIPLDCLKKIDPNFVKILPAQAIECCLYGYQNMSFNNEIESVFESLTLECEFTMKVINKQNNDATLLVDLFDASGNNVAALLIEKLASQKSQLPSLPANKITRSLLNDEENMNPNSEEHYVEIRSPISNSEKPSWRNSNDKDKQWNSGEKKNFRNANEEKNSWRNAPEDSPPKNRIQSDTWNGDSPTNKRSQRGDRSFSRNSNPNQDREGRKFSKRSPHNDSGKGNSWNNDSGKGNSWNNSGTESEKSWNGSVGSRGKNTGHKKDFRQDSRGDFKQGGFNQGRRNDFPKRNDFKNDFSKPEKRKPVELPPQDLAPLTQPFEFMEVLPESTENISISWFYNPENFFCQLIKNEQEFRNMMNDIQSAYTGRSPVSEDIPIGASVIAEFHEDSILYRATVLENKYPKYKVQYVDFGNMSLVDNSKLWQVEKRFLNLPIQAIRCSMANVKSLEADWPASEMIDNLFNKETFTCTFVGCDSDKYFVQLFDNDEDVRQKLIDLGIAVDPSTACQMVDEAVDLDILVGQNIRIRMSFIQGLDKFCVHLQQEKALIVQESIDTFMSTADIANLLKFSQEDLVVGATCLIQVQNTWKRGVIADNSDMASIQFEYPDFGDRGNHSSEEIYVLPQELCVYWYQGFECCLHNLCETTTKLVSDEDFKTAYEGQEVIIYVDEIISGRLFVTLYDLEGTKIELISPDDGAYPTVEPLCPMPILTTTCSVYISHVNNVNSIYLQRESDANKIAALLESLFEFFEPISDVPTLNRDDLCCAKSENDGNWYRGRITEINNETATVVYIDYGNSEILPLNNLRILDRSFFAHELAINVGLGLQETNPELTDKIIELTADKLFTASFVYGESGWIVDLTNNDLHLNQTLVDLNLASVQIEEIELVEEIPVDTRAQVTITHIDSPSEFYVQLIANESSIEALQADLQERANQLPDLEGADIGVLCAAKYTIDEQWYRAEVLDADAEITTVRFVDYGNTDVINNIQGSIKTLPADLLAVDKYAKKCSLNIVNKGEEWSQEASEIFENAVNVETIHADIVYQDEKNKTFIDLYVNGNNVADLLLQADLASPITRNDEENLANNTGFISHVNSISEFWIQLESSVPDLEMIVERLSNAESFADLQDLSPGILCAANFPDDEMWYRARILSNTVAGIEVLFVDYGNSSTAMKLKVLPEDLIQMPILAQKCSLNKPTNVDCWSEKANEKFREISGDGATIFAVKKLAPGETSIVELFIDGNNILDQLINLFDDETSAVDEPEFVKVHITHIETPTYFWVQLSSDSEKIDEMTEMLASAGSFKRLTNWDADTTCAALYLESGMWYRAKILEFNADTNEYEILLVDYGNTITTNELRALTDDIAATPPLVTLCSLELEEDCTEEMSNKFSNIIDGANDIQVVFINNDVPSLVRLFVNGKNVAEEICCETPQTTLVCTSSASLISDDVSLLAINTHLPETVEEIEKEESLEEVPEIQIKDVHLPETVEEKDVSVMDESYLTARGDEESFLNDSTETVKEASIVEEKSVETTNQENNIIDTTDVSNNNFCGEIVEEILQEAECSFDNQSNKIVHSSRHSISNDDRIISGLQCDVKDDIVDENISDREENTISEEIDISLSSSRPMTPHNEKIVPGSISRGDLEEPTELDFDEDQKLPEEQEEIIIVQSRPVTPHSEKIVPGSICRGSMEQIPVDYDNINFPVTPISEKIVCLRGDLEEPPINEKEETEKEKKVNDDIPTMEEVRPKTPIEDKIVPGSINKGLDLTEPPMNHEKEETEKEKKENDIPTMEEDRPKTPVEDKIVTGAISRGDLEKLPINEKEETEKEKTVNDDFPTIGEIHPKTPIEDKIVTGAISKDLEKPPVNEKEETEKEKKVNDDIPECTMEEVRPKTPVEDKIVPGSINKGLDLTEEPQKNHEKKETEREKKENDDIPTMEEVRPKTPVEDKIVPGSINKGLDLTEEPPKNHEKEETEREKKENDDIPTMEEVRPKIPVEDKVVSGAVYRGDLEKLPINEKEETEKEKTVNDDFPTIGEIHPKTPIEDKIVTGAISKDLEKPPVNEKEETEKEKKVNDDIPECTMEEVRPKTPVEDKIVPGSINKGLDLTEEPQKNHEKKETEREKKENDDIPTMEEVRPKTPVEDKIVPGSINKGLDLTEEPPKNHEKEETEREKKENDDIPTMEEVRPKIPVEDKVVSGAVYRGDLEKPPLNLEEDTKKERKGNDDIPTMEEVRPKTPVEDKIVPGSINKGLDLTEDIDTL